MSAAAAASLGRLVLGNLRTVLSRPSIYHAPIRNFYLQPACEAVMKVEMPSLSPTMERGTIIKWHKKEGEAVSPGDVLCDIQTDKAVVSMEYDDEGVLAKILKPDNSQDVEVGSLIALMVEEGDDWQNVEVPGDARVTSPAPSGAQAAAAAAAPPPASTGTIPGIKVEMPSLSPTMEMGTIIKWHKKEGDVITPGDVLCDIQTDKAVVSMEYDDEGVLAKILKPDNSKDVKVGELIAMMVAEGEDWTDVQVPAMTGAPAPAPGVAPSAPGAPTPPSSQPSAPQEAVVIDDDLPGVGPSVKKLLHEYNIQPTTVPGTGPKGNLTKGDLLTFIKAKGLHRLDPASLAPAAATQTAPPPPPSSSSPTPPAPSTPGRGEPYIDIPLTNMRKVIAKRLTESKTTVPHAYATIDCSMRTVTNTRKRFLAQGIKVSMNDFIIKAAGFALERSPKVNAINQGETAQTVASVDISVAVATEGGLITPIVNNVPALGVAEISQTVKALAEKARAGKLQPHEFQGGTFSISNLGMFGIKEFSAVINPPQVAILAIGTTRLTVGNENSIVDPKMAVTLSYDRRVMDEQDATRFLELFRLGLENPDVLVGGEMSPRNADLAFGSAV
ncbi:LOW QUALITY PROTEIN: pyruvate dehydrogenase protein X component, mitochondrial-like [Babylonia areolata]|uniref:LOW QUALITY PROTEIN: pyruvate dehydrogenase protein X component, mitochondrial-like n=1 Tax=Babylonia areolata TaxID=304850 RepID=UPI003FCF176F